MIWKILSVSRWWVLETRPRVWLDNHLLNRLSVDSWIQFHELFLSQGCFYLSRCQTERCGSPGNIQSPPMVWTPWIAEEANKVFESIIAAVTVQTCLDRSETRGTTLRLGCLPPWKPNSWNRLWWEGKWFIQVPATEKMAGSCLTDHLNISVQTEVFIRRERASRTKRWRGWVGGISDNVQSLLRLILAVLMLFSMWVTWTSVV